MNLSGYIVKSSGYIVKSSGYIAKSSGYIDWTAHKRLRRDRIRPNQPNDGRLYKPQGHQDKQAHASFTPEEAPFSRVCGHVQAGARGRRIQGLFPQGILRA